MGQNQVFFIGKHWRVLSERSLHTPSIPECLSEGVKLLKAEYLVRAIRKHKMDQAIVFCRTKLDCDNIERYLMKIGGGGCGFGHVISHITV